MNKFFQDLGRTILHQWKQENFSLAKFPEIACAALDKRPPGGKVDLASLMRDFLLAEDQPPQTDSEFGEPEIVVFSHPRFYIQLLFWMEGTTAIHQHEFSGAFHVLHGSSIHAHYDFEKAQSVTPYLRIGNLKLRKMELLEKGQTVPIVSGQGAIHSLFHLDSPSVTVVVRTQHDPGTGPQFNYLPPHVAFDPHFSDKLTMRRKQLLDVLAQGDDRNYVELVMEMIADLDFERGFSILHHAMIDLQLQDEWEPVLAAFEKKHGALAAGIGATLKEDARRGIIKGMRSIITEPDHRFFLALLMNAPTRDHVLALVAKRFPKQKPADVVLGWLEELADESDEGAAILDAEFPELVEVAEEAQLDILLAASAHFMNGNKKIPAKLRDLSADDLEELRSAFAESVLGVLIQK